MKRPRPHFIPVMVLGAFQLFTTSLVVAYHAGWVAGTKYTPAQVQAPVAEPSEFLRTTMANITANLDDIISRTVGSLGYDAVGVASWYGPGFDGNTMASGQPFNQDDPFIVAHRTLPFGTVLRIENLANGAVAIGVVRDRGPYIKGRELDCSMAMAKHLGMIECGLATVRFTAIGAIQ